MNFKIFTRSKKLLADTLTPVNIYLKLRDVYAGSFLLESSDYHGHENSLSFICCCPMASFQVDDGRLAMKYPDGSTRVEALAKEGGLIDKLDEFKNAFELQQPATKYISGGLFGYMAYDAVRYVEDINLARHNREIPDVWYKVFRYVIVVDHFSNQIVLHENTVSPDAPSGLEELQRVIYSNRFSTFSFSAFRGRPPIFPMRNT